MSDEISERKEVRLQRLYNARPEYKAFFNWTASRRNDSAETSVDTVMRRGRIDRETAVGLLQDLAKAGLGTFYVGRRGSKTRIEWSYSVRDIGAAARGTIEDVGEIEGTVEPDEDEEVTSGTVEHSFNLRPSLRILFNLPVDLTRREADRLGAFIKTLPLKDE